MLCGMPTAKACIFCAIVRGEEAAWKVYEDELTVAFLDHRPLLHGHCLLVPKAHAGTLVDLPEGLVAPVFGTARLLAAAVEAGLGADGSFVAINNKVSQSVPHLHVHVVPRWKNDGLFSPKPVWKRAPYKSDAERREVQEKIRRSMDRLVYS
jgi:histidine triad (HIT) family protein